MNRKIVLANRPIGTPKPNDFLLVDQKPPDLKQDEVLIKVQWLSIDPTIRIWISNLKSYLPPVALGQVIRSFGLGLVIQSRSPLFRPGNYVTGMLNWQQLSIQPSSKIHRVPHHKHPSIFLGVLGLTGITAYFAINDMAEIKGGQTVVVSAAAGAVGSIACQLAKLKGCKVIGITGSNRKIQWLLNTLKLDGAINYKEESVKEKLKELSPNGVDVFIDNVGGKILEEVLLMIRKFARVILCGSISVYNSPYKPELRNYAQVIFQSAVVRGFVMFDYANRYWMALRDLSKLLKEGKLTYREHIVQGLENAPQALNLLFSGENRGKMIVQVLGASPSL